jgi:ADP-ribose pyrophosphatase
MPSATAGTMVTPEMDISVASRRLVAENKVWNVYFARVIEGERVTPDYLVVEPKHRIAESVTGVCVLPIMDGKIGLVRIHRVAMAATFLEAPKGFVDAGEEAAGAALRELGEETGLTCEAGNVISLGSVTPEASTLAARVNLFAALDCRLERAREEEMGIHGLEFHAPEDVLAMAASSRIEDATTLAAIYRFMGRPA